MEISVTVFFLSVWRMEISVDRSLVPRIVPALPSVQGVCPGDKVAQSDHLK